MTPLGHIGIALPAGYVFKLSLPMVFLGAILPDLVDKPLQALGIGGGRYIAHTLLFAIVVSGLFYLWKRKYGVSVLIGTVSHLILDWEGSVPWFYPFKNYDFIKYKLDASHFFSNMNDLLRNNSGFSSMGEDLKWVLVAVAIVLIYFGLRYCSRRRKNRLSS